MHTKSRFRAFVAIIALALFSLQPLTAHASSSAAPLSQIAAGTYLSEEITGGESEGHTLELTLYDDTSALLVHYDASGDEALVEFGDWEESDGQVILTLTGDYMVDYEEPIEMTFDVDEETLIAAEYDQEKFGTDGFTLTFDSSVDSSDSASEDAVIFESVDAVDVDGNSINVTLEATGVTDADEGGITLTTENADGDVVVEVGSWSQTDTSSDEVQITLTGTEDEEYDEPVEILLLVDDQSELLRLTEASDGRYGEDGIALQAVVDTSSDSSSSDEDTSTPPGIYYSPSLMTDDSGTFYAPLIQLAEDGSAQWNTNYFDGTPAMSEVGSWELAEDGTLTITITGQMDGEGNVTDHEEPVVVTFDFSYDSIYNYDISLYMYKLSLPYDYSEETSSNESTESEESTVDESSSNESANIIYESGELADGSTISIEFAEDGTAVITTVFSDGGDDLVEMGEWTLDEGTDVLTLTITGSEEDEYAEPIEWVFDAGGDTLTAVEWDTDLYGEDAPVMEMVEE